MKKQHLILDPKDLSYLRKLLENKNLNPKVKKRVSALLQLNYGKTYVEVSKNLAVSYPTILGWSRKYKDTQLVFLKDKARSGRPAVITKAQRQQIKDLAAGPPPIGASRWSLRSLAKKVIELGICDTLSHNQVGIILKE